MAEIIKLVELNLLADSIGVIKDRETRKVLADQVKEILHSHALDKGKNKPVYDQDANERTSFDWSRWTTACRSKL